VHEHFLKRPRPAAAVLFAVAFVFCSAFAVNVRAAEPDWSPGWEEGLEEAKERNCAIIILAPRKTGTMDPCIFPEVFNDAEVVRLSGRFVCLLADDRRFPKVDTLYAARFVKPDSGKYGDLQVIFCTPDGTEVDKMRLFRNVGKAKLVDNMKIMINRHPGEVTRKEYLSCKARRDRAELLRNEGAYAQAIEEYEELAESKAKLKLVEEAKGKPEELKKEAAAKVEEAGKLLESDDAEDKKQAITLIYIYFYGMKRMEPHKKVQELLDKAKKDGSIRKEYSLAGKTAKAFEQFIKAELAYQKGDYKKAVTVYKKITRSYEDTRYYDRAKERIQEIVRKLTPEKTTP